MPIINPKINETINNSKYPEDIKQLLLTLINIELRNKGDGYTHYGEEYERRLSEIIRSRGIKGEE